MAENSTEEQVVDSETMESAKAQTSAEEQNVSENLEEKKENDSDTSGKSAASEDKPKEAKKSKRKPKHDKRDDEIAELKDRLTRNLAEFDNFRKRTEKEKAQMFDLGAKTMIEKLLPVIDNFERGLATLGEAGAQDPFAEGMEKTYKQLLKALEEAGVKTIEAVGKEFDPEFHNAVMHVEDDSFGENVVCEEFQKGYLYHDSVVRHSMVKVAN